MQCKLIRILCAVALSCIIASGCAHRDLKAPCTEGFRQGSESVPCDRPKAVNTIPSRWSTLP